AEVVLDAILTKPSQYPGEARLNQPRLAVFPIWQARSFPGFGHYFNQHPIIRLILPLFFANYS
ncbi:MAG: hypothetical protein K2O33_04530, partial [Muribaculaceae bacterium]|nr:hypothetical protein [Muribaculaceae bacterium]